MDIKRLNESTICAFGDSTTWGDNGCGGEATKSRGLRIWARYWAVPSSRTTASRARASPLRPTVTTRLSSVWTASTMRPISTLSLAASTTLAATCRWESRVAPTCMSSTARSIT